jgi:hypothetical protein
MMRGLWDAAWVVIAGTHCAIKDMAKGIESKVKGHYTVKPRKTERDDEIVRLRDEKNLPWGEIHKEICKKPAWATTGGEEPKPITQAGLRSAYARRKKQLQAPPPTLDRNGSTSPGEIAEPLGRKGFVRYSVHW